MLKAENGPQGSSALLCYLGSILTLPFPHLEDELFDSVSSRFSHLKVNEMSLISPNRSKKNAPTPLYCYLHIVTLSSVRFAVLVLCLRDALVFSYVINILLKIKKLEV